jgi:arylsulfatase A-like enzyme
VKCIEFSARPKNAHVDALLLAISLSLFITFVEILVAAHQPHWFGGSWHDWTEVIIGFLGFGLILWFTTELLAFLFRAVTLFRLTPAHSTVVGALIAGPLVWDTVSDLAEMPFSSLRIGVSALLAGQVLTGACCTATRTTSTRSFAALSALVWLSAIICVPFTTSITLFQDDSPYLRIKIPVIWSAIAFILIHGISMMSVRMRSPRIVRAVSVIAIVTLLPLVLACAFRFQLPSPQRNNAPNLLFISADTLRAQSLSVYGGPVATPALQSLADEGHLFEHAYALAPWTVPSFCGLFSSKYPPALSLDASAEQRDLEQNSYHRLGRSHWLDDSGRGFPERLAVEKGYVTSAFISNPLLFRHTWLLKGFEHRLFPESLKYGLRGMLDFFPTTQAALATIFPGIRRERVTDTTEILSEYACQYLRQSQDKKFFLWVHFMDPHAPYDPPAAYRTPRANDAKPPWDQFPPHPEPLDTYCADGLTPDQIQLARDLYQGEVRYVDHAVGRILSELRELGLDKTTYVVFLSDHGEELYERGRNGHGYSFFDEVMHVPLIMSGPGIKRGIIEGPVSYIDVVPTLADLLDLPAEAGWRGTSLVPSLRQEQSIELDRPCFAQATDSFRSKPEAKQMVVKGDFKLIRDRESQAVSMFNLEQDPGELTNIADTLPGIRDELIGLLDEWTDSFPSTFEEVKPAKPVVTNVSQSEIETLRSLGYAG